MAKELKSEVITWLNTEFFEKVLRKSESDQGIHVNDVNITRATNKGDNYTSDMYRAHIELTNGRKIKEKKQIIVKVEPTSEGVHKDLVSKTSLFSNEMTMIMEVLVKMNEILGDGKPLNGRGLYIQQKDPQLLVIEDLSVLGFRMASRHMGLDEQHAMLAIRSLARYHGSSVALVEKEPKWKDRLNCGMFNDKQPTEMHMFFNQAAKQLIQAASNWPELDKKILAKLERLSSDLYKKTNEACERRDDRFNVITHGDYWINNMLFKYDAEGRPIQHIFVDFQLPVYTSAAADIQYLFNTSIRDETLSRIEDKLLEEYLRSLAEVMARAGCRTKPLTRQELDQQMRDLETVGISSSISLLPIMTAEQSEVKDIEEVMAIAAKGEGNPLYNNKDYRKVIVRRILKWDQMGVFDALAEH